MAQYDYSNIAVNPVTLWAEVDASTFGSLGTNNFSYMNTIVVSGSNRDVKIVTGTDLSTAEQTELDGIISTHTP